jgi:hypothetical protein
MLAQIVAGLFRLFGPTVDEANAAVAAELEAREACEVPLLQQPYDCPERVRWALTAVSDRELPDPGPWTYRWYGRHIGDSHHELGLWKLGHRRGREGRRTGALRSWCPAHRDPEGMSTVGTHGLIYLYNAHYLDVVGNCIPWWLFAAPMFSAEAARERYLDLCEDRSGGWCPSPNAVFNAWRRRCDRRMLPREQCQSPVRAAGS